jgi:TPR repeat protein
MPLRVRASIIRGCVERRLQTMKLTLKYALAAILLMFSLAAPVAAGSLEDGYTAYTRGDFATAMRLMRPLADQGYVTAQTVVGLMYYFNYGGDYVSAYMWFTLAAAQGNAFAEMFLKDTADKMTREQVAQAEKLAREWKPTTQLPR